MEAADDRPVGFVGVGSGKSEVEALMEKVAPEVDGLSVENCGGRIDAEDFANFRMVVLVGLEEKTYSAEESQTIEDYVQEGGRLVLIGKAPRGFEAMSPYAPANLGYAFGFNRFFQKAVDSSISQPEDPLLAGVFGEKAEPFWLTANMMLMEKGWENIIGWDDYVLVGRYPMGQGELYYMGHELFRLAVAPDDGKEEALMAWIQIWKNILSKP